MISEQAYSLIQRNNIDVSLFRHCRGDQLQQVLHQESIDILTQISLIPTYSPIYHHQDALAECAAAISLYNQDNCIENAMTVADFCWSLLDYGQAIVEGAALGLYSTAEDLITHPIETTVCIVAGKQVLAYQLGKVLYKVLKLGITSLHDSNRAREEWNDYIEPISTIITAIQNKEIALRDTLKTGTALVVGYKAQTKLLSGMGNFCKTIKQQATRFAQNNISSFTIQKYLATPEGYLLRSIQPASCNAHCPNQYQHLKQWLRIKEFTSVIDTTQHGIERLIERGFTPEEVYQVIHCPTMTKIQKDGAIAYIKQIEKNFNVIIFNKETKKVVTPIKGADQHALNQLGKKYGWS